MSLVLRPEGPAEGGAHGARTAGWPEKQGSLDDWKREQEVDGWRIVGHLEEVC